jgi:hypothetical protein
MLLVDPASTSGALIPDTVFVKQVSKVPLKEYFGRTAFLRRSRPVDVRHSGRQGRRRVRREPSLHEHVATGKVKVDDFNYLWSSP